MAAVGLISQLVSIFKLLFGKPQVMILESVAVEKTDERRNKGQFIKRLSSVYNFDEDEDTKHADESFR